MNLLQSDILNLYPLLGEGVWGRAYDLQDGSVLKIAREISSGIGSGSEKIHREQEALQLLAATDMASFVPIAIGHGAIEPASPLALEGFSLWLRMNKKSGRKISADMAQYSITTREQLGFNIGRILASLHKAMALLPTRPMIKGPYGDIKKETADNGFYQLSIAALEKVYAAIPPERRSMITHGDFNMSNLLFDGLDICAILDFAEWGPCFPEKDLSDILNESPILRDPLVKGYESLANFKIDPNLLELGLAENALYGAVIEERNGHKQERDQNCQIVINTLGRLGYNF